MSKAASYHFDVQRVCYSSSFQHHQCFPCHHHSLLNRWLTTRLKWNWAKQTNWLHEKTVSSSIAPSVWGLAARLPSEASLQLAQRKAFFNGDVKWLVLVPHFQFSFCYFFVPTFSRTQALHSAHVPDHVQASGCGLVCRAWAVSTATATGVTH